MVALTHTLQILRPRLQFKPGKDADRARLSQVHSSWQPVATVLPDIYEDFQCIRFNYPVLPVALGFVEHVFLGLVFYDKVAVHRPE